MSDENKKEFKSTYTLDYKKYKEFSKSFIATNKSNIIVCFLIVVLFIIYLLTHNYSYIILFGIFFVIILGITKITGRSKLPYKRSKSLNNDKDLETTITINNEKIVGTSKKGDVANYEFNQIIGIVETKSFIILKLKYNMGIIINKSNITGGTKEELIQFLLDKCINLKKKKVIQSKKWLITRKVILILSIIMFIVAIVLSVLKQNEIDKYAEKLEQNNYNVEMQTTQYNGRDTEKLTITKDSEYFWGYLFDFSKDDYAKRNIEYWVKSETENDIKDEYIIEDNRNYEKYVIKDEDRYVVFIRKDNFVFQGIGYPEYAEQMDSLIKFIDNEILKK